jgi:RNA polymerase sigma factor (TIGR02999 family)
MTQGVDITTLLTGARAGDREAQARLFEVVYGELRRMAAGHLRNERRDHTLQPSALVHEAYLRLLGRLDVPWENRAHFFTTAAGTMRRILIDHARTRRAQKRDGALRRVDVEHEPSAFAVDADADRLLVVDEALTRLAAWDERQARVVELRFFAGLTVDETAEVLGISSKTVKRDWSMARAWLQTQFEGGERVG